MADDKGLLMRGTAILVGLGIGLLCLEGVVRFLFRYNTPDTVRSQSLQYQPSLFARHLLKPNVRVAPEEAWGSQPGQVGGARTYAVNDRGTRGRSFEVPKPQNVCRIVVLGGSSAFDAYATEGRDWPHLVEQDLRARGFAHVEVVNAAVPGHASFDSLGRLYTQLWMWAPDYLVLYHGWNDIKYWATLDDQHPLIAHLAPFDSQLDPFQNYRNVLDRVLSSSQAYVKLRNAYFIRATSVGPEGRVPGDRLADTFGPAGPQQFRLINQLLVAGAHSMGATPVLVTEASLVHPGTAPDDRARIRYGYVGLTHHALVNAYRELNEILRRVASEQGAPFLNLASLNGRSEWFVDHVHTTPAGSRMVAAAVGEELARALRNSSCPAVGPAAGRTAALARLTGEKANGAVSE